MKGENIRLNLDQLQTTHSYKLHRGYDSKTKRNCVEEAKVLLLETIKKRLSNCSFNYCLEHRAAIWWAFPPSRIAQRAYRRHSQIIIVISWADFSLPVCPSKQISAQLLLHQNCSLQSAQVKFIVAPLLGHHCLFWGSKSPTSLRHRYQLFANYESGFSGFRSSGATRF